MEAKLSIKQRLNLIALLQPMSASAAKRKLLNTAIDELSLSESEIKDSGYSETVLPTGGMNYVYHPAQDPMKTVAFGEVVCDCLSRRLVELDKQEKIDGDTLPLFEMFVKT